MVLVKVTSKKKKNGVGQGFGANLSIFATQIVAIVQSLLLRPSMLSPSQQIKLVHAIPFEPLHKAQVQSKEVWLPDSPPSISLDDLDAEIVSKLQRLNKLIVDTCGSKLELET